MQSVRCLARPNAARSKRRKRAAVPLFGLLALLVAAVFAPFAKAVPSESPQATWVTDKSVKATAKSGDTLYIGGEFEQVAPRTGPAAAFDATTAELTGTPLISGSLGVEAEVVEPDGSGGYYVGGNYSHAQGEPRQGIVHVKADGSLDPNFALELRERVYAIEVVGNVVYIGGRISEVNGEVRNSVAAFDAETGELLPWSPEVSERVYALAVDGEYVYVGGTFSTVNGESRNRLASVTASGTGAGEGEVTSWFPLPNSDVYALEISGSTLYVGGKFTQLEGEEHKYLGSFDLSSSASGEPDLTSWAPVPSNYVMGIAVSEDGQNVYAGGEFTQVNSESHKHIAAIKASDGTPIEAWVGETNSKVRDLVISGSTLYAAGDFSEAEGQTRRAAAAFEAEGTGTLLEWNPGILGSGHSVAVTGSNVVVGGFFNGANAIDRDHIAAIDLTTGEATDWAPEANQNVYALAMSEDETRVFVGGYYTQIGGEARERLASLKAAGTGEGEGEPTAWNPKAANSVEAIAVDGSRVYVGGGFPTLSGKSAFARLAAFDFTGDAGTLDESWKPAPNNDVYVLAADGEKVYVGGQFSSIGGQTRNNLALVNDTDGAASESWAPEPNSRVRAIALSGTGLFAGGLFETVGGESHKHVVEIDSEGDPTAWSGETDGEVYGVATDGSAVYVGGSFNKANGDNSRKKFVAFDSSGELLSWYPGSRDTVYRLEYADAQLIAAGAFHSTELGAQKNIAVFGDPVLSVATAGEGSGKIAYSGAEGECGSTCSTEFLAGEEVTLTASPEPGSEFVGWSGGGCTGTDPCLVTLNADVVVTAEFAVSSSPEEEGAGEEGGGSGSGSGAEGSGTGSGSGPDAAGAGVGDGTGTAAKAAWVHAKIMKAKIRHQGNRAGFWFATKGTEGAKRLYCSLVKKPAGKNARKQLKRIKVRFKPCGPRKRIYRNLKPGRYVFRVRAVGKVAWDRRPAKRAFRIH